MKTLIIHFTEPLSYTLPEGMDGQAWKIFKRDYSNIIEKRISEARHEALIKNKLLSYLAIDIDSLPVLTDDLDSLKDFMKNSDSSQFRGHMTIEEWNSQRELAKNFFTSPCISELDASGYIKKLVR